MKTVTPTYHAKTVSFRPLHSEDISDDDLANAGKAMAGAAWQQFEKDLLEAVIGQMGVPAEFFTSSNTHRTAAEYRQHADTREPDFDNMKRAEPVPTKPTLLLQ